MNNASLLSFSPKVLCSDGVFDTMDSDQVAAVSSCPSPVFCCFEYPYSCKGRSCQVSGSLWQRQPSRCQPRNRPGAHQNVISSPASCCFLSDHRIHFLNAVLLRSKAKTTFQPLWYSTLPNCPYEPIRLCFLSAEHIVQIFVAQQSLPFHSQFCTYESFLILHAQVLFPRTRD